MFHLPYIVLLLGHHRISLSGSFYFPLRAQLNYYLPDKGFDQPPSVGHFSYTTLHGTMYLHNSLGNCSFTLMYALAFNKYLLDKQINESSSYGVEERPFLDTHFYFSLVVLSSQHGNLLVCIFTY